MRAALPAGPCMASRGLLLCANHLAGTASAPPRAAALHAVGLPPHHTPACGLQDDTGGAGGRAWMRLFRVWQQWQRQRPQQSSNSAAASQQAASLSFPSRSSAGCWPAFPGLPDRGSSGCRCQRKLPCPAVSPGGTEGEPRVAAGGGAAGASAPCWPLAGSGTKNPPPPPRPCLQAPAPPAGPVGAFGATACPCPLLAEGSCCRLAATKGAMLRMSRRL